MGRRLALCLVAAAFAVLPGCGGGGSGGAVLHGADAAPSAVLQAGMLDDLLRGGRTLVDDLPPGLKPPIVRPTYLSAAERLALLQTRGKAIGGWANRFTTVIWEETPPAVSWSQVKRVSCVWFRWYLETGELVPAPAEFERLFLEYLLDYLPSTPPDRLSGAVGLFRSSIESAQSWGGLVANTAAATVCTAP